MKRSPNTLEQLTRTSILGLPSSFRLTCSTNFSLPKVSISGLTPIIKQVMSIHQSMVLNSNLHCCTTFQCYWSHSFEASLWTTSFRAQSLPPPSHTHPPSRCTTQCSDMASLQRAFAHPPCACTLRALRSWHCTMRCSSPALWRSGGTCRGGHHFGRRRRWWSSRKWCCRVAWSGKVLWSVGEVVLLVGGEHGSAKRVWGCSYREKGSHRWQRRQTKGDHDKQFR